MAAVADLCTRNPWLASFPVSVPRLLFFRSHGVGIMGNRCYVWLRKTIELAIVVETAIGRFGRLWRDNRMNHSGVLPIPKKSAHSELMTIRSSPNNAVKSTLGQIIVIA